MRRTEKPMHLTTAQLAKRWAMKPATLRNWRTKGIGPRFMKPSGKRGRALYRLRDIEAWERRRTYQGES